MVGISFSALDLSPTALALILSILAASALMSGLSGFGFSAIGALCLWLLPPQLGVPLLMSLSAANQLMSLGQLKADVAPWRRWWPDGPAPYILGGLIGVPVGLMLLHTLPDLVLMALFGAFLVGYAAYATLKPNAARKPVEGGRIASALVGLAGGVIGGFTAFPGAALIVWSGLRQLSKRDTRAIVQPYILCLQIVSLVLLAIRHPHTFDRRFWLLLALSLPVVLPSTLLGVRLYRSLSDIGFRHATFMLLGASGLSLLVKAATTR